MPAMGMMLSRTAAGGGGGVGTNPISAKLAGWWDADNVTTAAGSTTSLFDRTGNGNHLPAIVAAPAPTTVSGKLVLQPTGTEHYDLDPLSTIPTQDDICLLAVAKPASTGSGQGIHGLAGSGAPPTNQGISITADSNGGSIGGPGAYLRDFAFEGSDIAVDAAARHLYIVNRSGTLTRLYKNGAPLLPVYGTAVNTGYSKASVFGPDHFFIGDWRTSMIASSITRQEVSDMAAWSATNEGTTDSSPAASYAADDDFSVGASIDTAGTRFAGATAWTGLNVGSLTNAIAGGTLSLTLAQESTLIFRGYTQPTAGSGVEIYRTKIIPANLGTVDLHHAGLLVLDTATTGDPRAVTIEVGYDSGSGSRQIRTCSYFLGSPWTQAAWMTQFVGGFTSGDWSQEWTLWAAFDGTAVQLWYQIGSGQPQYLATIGWLVARSNLIGIGVTSQNAAGGTAVADFTDFAREF